VLDGEGLSVLKRVLSLTASRLFRFRAGTLSGACFKGARNPGRVLDTEAGWRYVHPDDVRRVFRLLQAVLEEDFSSGGII